MSKVKSNAKLKVLPDDAQDQLHEFMRDHSVKDGVVFCRDSLGVETSAGALSDWWGWYERRVTLQDAAEITNEIKAAIKSIPELDIEDETINRYRQKHFEILAMKSNDPKLFASMRRLRISERNADMELNKFKQTMKSDMEKGLEALFQEIRGNPEAEELFGRLKAVVMKSMEGAGK